MMEQDQKVRCPVKLLFSRKTDTALSGVVTEGGVGTPLSPTFHKMAMDVAIDATMTDSENAVFCGSRLDATLKEQARRKGSSIGIIDRFMEETVVAIKILNPGGLSHFVAGCDRDCSCSAREG
jgi:hypothetical protein